MKTDEIRSDGKTSTTGILLKKVSGKKIWLENYMAKCLTAKTFSRKSCGNGSDINKSTEQSYIKKSNGKIEDAKMLNNVEPIGKTLMIKLITFIISFFFLGKQPPLAR